MSGRLDLGDPRVLGELIGRGDPVWTARVARSMALAGLSRSKARGRTELDGVVVHFKHGPLDWKHALRHGLRKRLLGREFPRLAEFDNLAWLRRNGFHAPEPLAAGAFVRGGMPLFQFLHTREVPRARTLAEVLSSDRGEIRGRALRSLAGEIARLHALGFVHRDLFPRNVLVTDEPPDPRVHFLDCWRGGPHPGLRGPAYDIACLMLFCADLLSPKEQGVFFDAYFEPGSWAKGAPNRKRLLAAAARDRRRLERRFRTRRRAESVLALPAPEWDPRGLGL